MIDARALDAAVRRFPGLLAAMRGHAIAYGADFQPDQMHLVRHAEPSIVAEYRLILAKERG